MRNDFGSIAHWENVEAHGDLLVHRNTIGGLTWVRIYRGTAEKCQYVAQLKQTKTGRLTHYITGQRFGSIEKALSFYGQAT